MDKLNGRVAHMNRSRVTYILSIGQTLCFCAITLCLTVLFWLGYLMFVLASLLILFVSLAHYMVSKLVDLCMHLLKGIISALRGQKF